MSSKYFTIEKEKMEQVYNLFVKEIDETITIDQAEEVVCQDWPEGSEHQEWLNNATPREIADWLVTLYFF